MRLNTVDSVFANLGWLAEHFRNTKFSYVNFKFYVMALLKIEMYFCE